MAIDGLNRRLLIVFLALFVFICHSCDIWRVGLIDSQQKLCFETGVGKVCISLNDFGCTWLELDCEGEYLLYPDSIKVSRKDNKRRDNSIGDIRRNYLFTGPIEKEPFIANNERVLVELPYAPLFGKYILEIDLTEFIRDINGDKVIIKPFTLTF